MTDEKTDKRVELYSKSMADIHSEIVPELKNISGINNLSSINNTATQSDFIQQFTELPQQSIAIPPNHRVTGTCGICGGLVIRSIIWAGSTIPSEYCMNCGRNARPIINYVLPVREMI